MRSTSQAVVLDAPLDQLFRRIKNRTARVGILGLGYVGLPLAIEFARHFHVRGFDPDGSKVEGLNNGRSHILDVPAQALQKRLATGKFQADTDFSALTECDAVIICVPTPLERDKDPNLSYVENAAQSVARSLRPGQLIVLESTTYPGTTDEFMLPLLSRNGLELDRDFLLAFSPERVDPGNMQFNFTDITKVVGGCSRRSTDVATLLYSSIMREVFPVSSARVAETAKLLENTFRSVNIALANEMALLCDRLDIDTHEVIEAASTKPFGFMAFQPGPGVGGHCIPLDPLYLTWRAKQQGFNSRMIAVADEINSAMPEHVVDLIGEALNERGKPLNGARIVIFGVSYKENIDDIRHSPATPIVDRLRGKRALVSYHDPHVPHFEIDVTEWPEWRQRTALVSHERRRRLGTAVPTDVACRRRNDSLASVPFTDELLVSADCIVILAKHSGVDYDKIAKLAQLVVDTRGTFTTHQHSLMEGRVVTL